ncbi:YqgQ family protein [Ureibacillus terrenus]|uniref:YqgQ family protein n=1 Tax=Ureibacillus terrenus TaxID=118246 RepID=UPI002E1D85A9|nr:YqgQ family protein [Ureibacillus terrenus]
MKNILDIRNLLKRYGSFIYTGDRLGDLMMMEDEIRELYKSQLLDPKEFQSALLIIRNEMKMEEERKNECKQAIIGNKQ